ncbi:hypothetical protein CC86DRAFT_52663 [Ophiobolus disseminans]|uniref:RanBD1 domain-containing protein n=1 Tax=Ophiobolus disseminans TaxID=1469910 RepID=A0A6A6ZUX5_9PLEO|nr:hypothetical protein CC86DRAFT_52663 [Ophiobolus disseminans]
MAGSSEQPEAIVETTSAAEAQDVANPAPTSPARSDDSDGKPVRDKLKETRIDAQATSNPAPTSDQQMDDVPNGNATAGEQSASGSDSDRGRLRKKRSREDFEDGTEDDKQPGKKHEKEERHHVRKRSRDVKDIESGAPIKPATNSVATIQENDADEQMTSPSKDTLKPTPVDTSTGTDASPKNKRTRDQVEEAATPVDQTAKDPVANGKPVSAEDERESKRPRDKDDIEAAGSAKAKVPSGFSNTSVTSPFAAITPKPQAAKDSDRPESLPQTSDDKFKNSGFGKITDKASPFGGFGNTSSNTSFGGFGDAGNKSPFAVAGGNKLSTFGGSITSSTTPATGFGALGGSTKSGFGGSTFGASAGGFASLGGSKAPLASFGAATPSDLTIKGLKSKTTAFGTPGEDKDADASDDDDGDDDDTEKDDTDKERQSSQPLLSQQPHETGEEGETTTWTGRTKLYTMSGEGSSRAWQERGSGTFKLNLTVDEPKKARFVLRADGTHRLLLNAAVTKQMVFGGDSSGEKPKDTRLLFNAPTASGELEMHLLKLKAERAVELWEEVHRVQETEL